jgi:glutamate mutase epsilon subunit
MTLEPDAIALCFIHNNSTSVTPLIAIGYVNLEWLNAASRPLSSIAVGYANYGMNSVSHITDMVKCRHDDP